MHRPGLCLLAIAVLAHLGLAHRASAQTIDHRQALAEAAQCDAAISSASRALGVPQRLMRALAPTESGISSTHGQRLPWPWTLNTNGHGSYHFRSREAAARHLAALIAAGIDNVDIGCMQINWHWHGAAFASPDAALSPALNVRYAALLLHKYRAQTGSWAAAVGLYHTRNTQRADDYRCRVARTLDPRAEIRDCDRRTPRHD
jgi:hypothetical protein